uniref:Golgi integral membrane protein 4 n=1 Tax=Stomoxys calcitrans TaxID=35570 RepID=A0A1I8Q7P7_STOCA
MSGTRFARTGRCRYLVCVCILVLMVGMVAIFHSSQIQLDESREERLRCEKQQEALNERLTTLVEQKIHLEKNQERERTEFLETKRNLEQKIKNLDEKYQKEQVEAQMNYEKLEQAHKLLQSKHKDLKEANIKSNRQNLDNINGLESKVQSLKSELKKEKSNKSGEVYFWKEKYDAAEREKSRLEELISTKDTHQQLERVKVLEQQLKQYESQCDLKSKEMQRNPVVPKPNISDNNNPSTSQKTFNLQEPVSDGVYRITVNTTNNSRTNNMGEGGGGGGTHQEITPINPVDFEENKKITATTKQDIELTNTNAMFKPLITKHYNGSLILNSVENFQIVPKPVKRIPEEEEAANVVQKPAVEENKNQVAPLGAPKHKTSSPATKSEPQMVAAAASNATSANARNGAGKSSSSTSNSPPLALPPNQKKLPENVAPYPENFEDLLQKTNNEQSKNDDAGDLNQPKASALKAPPNNNFDFGAHEVNDNINDDSNLPHDEDNNFFDADNDAAKHPKDNVNNDDDEAGLLAGDNEVEGGAAAGDIAVKHNQQLLENLKNEVAEDQGKEFADGLRLDEGEGGALEEDDDDDYSNPSARKKADKAIRH